MRWTRLRMVCVVLQQWLPGHGLLHCAVDVIVGGWCFVEPAATAPAAAVVGIDCEYTVRSMVPPAR